MKTSTNAVLITGGSAGIGFAIAKKCIHFNNTVIITGRDEERLKKAKQLLPKVHAITSDVTNAVDRKKLLEIP